MVIILADIDGLESKIETKKSLWLHEISILFHASKISSSWFSFRVVLRYFPCLDLLFLLRLKGQGAGQVG
jgi:hypothetical protein